MSKEFSKKRRYETNSLLLKMGGKLNNFTADNPGWIRPIRIHVAPSAQTRTQTRRAGTSHLSDVGRSNVLQLVRLRKSRRMRREGKRTRERTEGESASEEARKSGPRVG